MLYERFLRELRVYQGEISALILQEGVEDYSSYRYLLGKYRGVEEAIELLRETFRHELSE